MESFLASDSIFIGQERETMDVQKVKHVLPSIYNGRNI